MPAYETCGSQVIHLGVGDICICTARDTGKAEQGQDYDDEIAFVVDREQHPIGERSQDYKGSLSDEIPCPVRIIFENVESLDVLAEQLQVLRAGMIAAKNTHAEAHA